MRHVLAFALFVAAPAAAQELPHRSIEVERHTAAPMAEVQACMAGWIKPLGTPNASPIDGGVAMVVEPKAFIGKAPDPYTTIEIRDDGAVRRVTMLYRHPWNAKMARNLFKNAAKKCALGDEVALVPAL